MTEGKKIWESRPSVPPLTVEEVEKHGLDKFFPKETQWKINEALKKLKKP